CCSYSPEILAVTDHDGVDVGRAVGQPREAIGAAGSASPQVGVGGREEDAVGTGQSYLRRSQMPPDASVMSAWEGPWLCSLRYSSALLPKSFERPGPQSVSPATTCSGVAVV